MNVHGVSVYKDVLTIDSAADHEVQLIWLESILNS